MRMAHNDRGRARSVRAEHSEQYNLLWLNENIYNNSIYSTSRGLVIAIVGQVLPTLKVAFMHPEPVTPLKTLSSTRIKGRSSSPESDDDIESSQQPGDVNRTLVAWSKQEVNKLCAIFREEYHSERDTLGRFCKRLHEKVYFVKDKYTTSSLRE
ncbi:hypothetical protein DL93DRAFT_500029 [Clavulina sp. PMI_390]|nr:hypothetical protein DL93DRAFT_500029 [Clavulina sp. PMI_390]